MLSQPIPQLNIPKYITNFSDHLIPRSKLPHSHFYPIPSLNRSPLHSPADTIDDDHIPSPLSPQPQLQSPAFDYSSRNSAPFNNSDELYHTPENNHSCATPQFFSVPDVAQHTHGINSSAPATDSDQVHTYLSESPSPVDAHRSIPALPHPISAPPDVTPFSAEDRIPTQTEPGSERDPCEFNLDKYSAPNVQNPLLDQRRMSEPAALSGPTLYATHSPDHSVTSRYQHFNFAFNPPALHASRASASLYASPPGLQRGVSTSALRELRHHHFEYPPQQTEWKHDDDRHPDFYGHRADALDEPLSPMQPNFTGGLMNSPTLGVPYSPIHESHYGPSPPGTGTSTSSSVAPLSSGISSSPHSLSQHLHRSGSNIGSDGIDRKTYSFVALPGNAVKKRPRRRYDEIERLYQCSWPDCTKSYGTLNHLNAHVTMQKHGPKRSPNEFKELRKQWRKAKKESDAAVAGVHRRESYHDGYDDHNGYGHRYLASHSLHQRQHSSHHPGFGLPATVSIPHPGSAERYAASIDDIRYPPIERADSLTSYGSLATRQRYTGSLSSSWPSGSPRQAYISPSLPTHPAHHSHLPQLAIDSRHEPSGTNPLNRLPQNSTLLTPLPGYHTPSMIPPSQGSGNINYSPETFELYENDSNGRPGTGHASLGHASGDEYDPSN